MKSQDLVKMEKLLDKILRFNDAHDEHELDRVTSLRTLCYYACVEKKESKLKQEYRECGTNTDEESKHGGPSEI